MGKDDKPYLLVKQKHPEIYRAICGFASVFGKWGEDTISLSTRYQVERFCMSLVEHLDPAGAHEPGEWT